MNLNILTFINTTTFRMCKSVVSTNLKQNLKTLIYTYVTILSKNVDQF